MMQRTLITLAVCAVLCLAQGPQERAEPPEPKLPDGRSQKEEILKADHERTLKDAAELVKLSEDLKIDIEKNDRHVLSVATLKKLDEIEKLTRRIRGRMKRF